VRIGFGVSKKTISGKKKDADRCGINTEISGAANSLSIAGSRTSSCPLLEIALSAMVMIGMIDPIGAITMMIDDLMGRLGGKRQFMIAWGAGSVYMIGLVIVLNIFPGTRKSLKRWQMLGFPISSCFAGMLIPIMLNQGNIVVHRQGSHHFPVVSRGVD